SRTRTQRFWLCRLDGTWVRWRNWLSLLDRVTANGPRYLFRSVACPRLDMDARRQRQLGAVDILWVRRGCRLANHLPERFYDRRRRRHPISGGLERARHPPPVATERRLVVLDQPSIERSGHRRAVDLEKSAGAD